MINAIESVQSVNSKGINSIDNERKHKESIIVLFQYRGYKWKQNIQAEYSGQIPYMAHIDPSQKKHFLYELKKADGGMAIQYKKSIIDREPNQGTNQ